MLPGKTGKERKACQVPSKALLMRPLFRPGPLEGPLTMRVVGPTQTLLASPSSNFLCISGLALLPLNVKGCFGFGSNSEYVSAHPTAGI